VRSAARSWQKIGEVGEGQEHRSGIGGILRELREGGLRASGRRVRRPARAAGAECVHPRPYVRTTLPDAQAREGLAGLADRDSRPAAAGRLRAGGITCVPAFCGFAYRAAVIDLFSGKGGRLDGRRSRARGPGP